MAVNLELLTDDDIIDYTRSDGKDRILTNHRDINLKFRDIAPEAGGVYDVEIFGSPFEDRCICGRIRRASPEPCPYCGARVFTKKEGLRRFARIELPFYYLNDLRFDIFKELFDQIFEGVTIKLDFQGDDFKNDGYSGRGAKKLGIKVFDTCQFEYSKAKKELKVSEFITDEEKCSYEGLMKIIEENFPEHLTEFRKMINRYYIVLPAMMRPFSLQRKGGEKKMNSHKLSVWYSIVIRLCCVDDIKANTSNYNEVMKRFKTPGERVRYTALLRAFLNAGKKQATGLLNTSKKNEARGLYSVRVKNSARTAIIPDTELKVDELGVPIGIAYEMCREGFIKYLMDTLNFTKEEAIKATKKEAENPETMKLFKEYAEQQMVLCNRQPTLHEYGIYCLKLRIKENQDVISYPIELCGPLNADFDGDTVSITLVPEEVKEDTYNKMSPRYKKIYKKNLQPIFVFNHETLNGLNVASTYVYDDPEELKDPRHFYDDYSKLIEDVETGVIKYGTPITFTGTVGGIKYQNKITSYGRLRLSKIIGADIDTLDLFKNPPYEAFKAGSALKLVQYLYKYDDFVEKMNEIQKFALKCVTKAGVVTFDFKTLYVDTDTETYGKIRDIVDNPKLDEKQKLLMVNELYAKYEKEVEDRYSKDLKDELSRAGRVKIASIADMTRPQFIVSGTGEEVVVNHGDLLSGLSEKDYIYHAVENRSLQSIKNSGVPTGGYLTRQITFLLNNYVYKTDVQDDDNPGLYIPRYIASGRMAPNGKIYPEVKTKNEDELVPVRSIVTKRSGNLNVVSPDDFSVKFKQTNLSDGMAIGASLGTSLTENVTQSLLALKHGGHERTLSADGNFYAPKKCTFRTEGKWIYLKVYGGELKYPLPDNWVGVGKDKFNEGDLIGAAYNTTSPAYRLNAIIKCMRARGGNGVRYFEKDNVILGDCYAYEEGPIHYVETKKGDIEVFIGNRQYDYNPDCLYYFPEGATVKKYQRFCSGVVNMAHVMQDTNDISDSFNIFRRQFYALNNAKFEKTGIVEDDWMQEEILELVFAGMIDVKRNEKTGDIDELEYQGIHNSILNRDSFFTTLSYGYSSKVVAKALKGELAINNDIMTETVLGLLLNDKLDEN